MIYFKIVRADTIPLKANLNHFKRAFSAKKPTAPNGIQCRKPYSAEALAVRL